MVQTLQTSIEIPQSQITDKVIDVPVVQAEHVPHVAQSEVVEIEMKTIDLEWVQVHPAGLVKPDDPDAQIKFLAAESLHRVHGNRLANELGRREYVTEEMWKNKLLFRLALNKAASDDIAWQCKHYTGRGVMKLHESGTALAEGMGVPVSKMPGSIEVLCQASLKTAKDPDRGPYPAYPSGKSWCEACGKTGSGKKFYHNVMSGADFAAQHLSTQSTQQHSSKQSTATRVDGRKRKLGKG